MPEVIAKGNTVVITHELDTPSCLIDVQSSQPHNQATVLAVGPGRWLDNGHRHKMTVKAGDRVLIGRFNGLLYEHVGKTVRYVQEEEIMAVLERVPDEQRNV